MPVEVAVAVAAVGWETWAVSRSLQRKRNSATDCALGCEHAGLCLQAALHAVDCELKSEKRKKT